MSLAPRTRPRIHRAWWVAFGVLAALVAAAGFRSSTGALIEPIEAEFGWSRATTSGAVTANLVIYGLTAPFAAALMERFGLRRVLTCALLLVSLGSGLTVLMKQPWQLWLLWGLFVGVGTGAMALVLGSIVANRWFATRRGLVTGFFSAASSTGQLVFLPAFAALAVGPGWRYAALITSAVSLLLVPVALFVVADRPEDVGTTPYGAESAQAEAVARPAAAGPVDMDGTPRHTEPPPQLTAVGVLREALPSWPFWVLMGTFFVCGWSTNGLVGTHFIPAAHDHGMTATTAAGLLALVGIFDIAGTIASGWLTDRVDPRLLLVAYYVLRGLSLLLVPVVLGPGGGAEPVPLHRVLWAGLGGDRAPDDGAVPALLRPGSLQHRLRLGVRLAHGGRRDRGLVCRVGASEQRRLLHGVAYRRGVVHRGRVRVPAPHLAAHH